MVDIHFLHSKEESEFDLLDKKSTEKLVQRFLDDGLISKLQVRTIRDEIDQTGENIISAIERSNIISPLIIASYVNNIDILSVKLSNRKIIPDITRKIPKSYAIQYKLIAFDEERSRVHIAFVDPNEFDDTVTLSNFFDGKEIIQYIAKESEIVMYIDKIYEYEFVITDIIDEMELTENIDVDNINKHYTSPVMRLVDNILQDAVHKDASDIHIQPDENFVRVRYRMDGAMQNQFTFPRKFYDSIIVRIKIISGMNIAESMRPQDGAIKQHIIGRNIDFRVSLMPTTFGEGVVMRILDKKENIASLDNLQIHKNNYNKIKKIINTPEGVLIMTGPTGSGKTTTLYALISHLSTPDVNIMTLEDPVEYSMPMARQMNVNSDAGITFASGLRAILRQDPDIILIGEMRDEETAITAMRASMTGHKVFSTLHTNNAPSAISRLIDLGVSRHIISTAVNGIIAQRLLRVLCPKCKIQTEVTLEDLKTMRLSKAPVEHIYKADINGCNHCRKTGYKGRTAIMEVIHFDKTTRASIEDGATEHALVEKLTTNKHFEPLKIDGLRKVVQGLTSLDELCRVVDMS